MTEERQDGAAGPRADGELDERELEAVAGGRKARTSPGIQPPIAILPVEPLPLDPVPLPLPVEPELA